MTLTGGRFDAFARGAKKVIVDIDPVELENANIKKRCSKWDSREINGNVVVDAVCTSGRGVTITKHIVTSLAGDKFHEESTSSRGTATSDGKWLGPCKPGQKPDALK